MIIFPGIIGAISKVFSSVVSVLGWSQQTILTGTLASATNDNYGIRVDINAAGDKLVVCADLDESLVAATDSGLAYVYNRSSGNWVQEQILSGTLAIDSTDRFGTAVAINSAGNRIVVGASSDERTGTTGEGLAYVFTSGSGGWTQEQILSGTLAVAAGDAFGNAVAINSTGDRIVVGAIGDERTGTTGEGLAYVFLSGAGGWTQEQILSGSLAVASSDRFGISVAINSAGDRIIVGADSDERTGTNNEGLAYIFVNTGGLWSQQQILSGTLAVTFGDSFGRSVSMNGVGDRVVVGANVDERTGTTGEGLAYVFLSGGLGWSQQTILSGTLAIASSDSFGIAVDMNSNGDRIVIGASGDERTGINGEGLAYIFTSGSGGWTQEQILSGTLAIDNSDGFGVSVAINSTGNYVLIGANQDELVSATNYGTAYVFVSGS